MTRILVVEDEPSILFGLRSDLEFQGYTVEVAEDGETASRRASESAFDLILLDVMLPRKDGFSVARDLRRAGFKTPIIMLTACGLEHDKLQGLDVGADDYMTKPFSPRELRARIKALLRRSENRSDLANQKQLEHARSIQQRLMPSHIPQFEGFRIAGTWRPAQIVGGDYFDVLKFDEGAFAVCIADVCGKGMPAALMMANLQAVVKTSASRRMRPRDLCAAVNLVMCQNMAAQGFITFFYAFIDCSSRLITYCNAGHNPPILARNLPSTADCLFRRLDHGGGILGVFDWPYEEEEISLGSGDRILMYTDGVTESRNSSGEEFGESRLIDLALRSEAKQASELAAETVGAATRFSNGNFDDDLTVLAISVD